MVSAARMYGKDCPNLRHTVFLLQRILLAGEDNRFDEIRSKFLSFLGFFVGQMVRLSWPRCSWGGRCGCGWDRCPSF